MSTAHHFAAYAAAFEQAVASDDWSDLERFFTDDAIYEAGLVPPMGGRFEGRPQILAYFKDVLDRFDRRFERRELELVEGPRADADSLWIRGRALYSAPGVPDLVLELEETAWFDGDRIRRLEDRYEPEMLDEIAAYLAAHGDALGISIPPDDSPA